MTHETAGATRKTYFSGTHRSLPPEETLRRAEACFPRVGITRLADITHLDRVGIPVFQAVRPASRNLSVSQGKGTTVAASKASAVMEGIELWHAEDLSHLEMRRATPGAMARENPPVLHQLPWRGDGRSFDKLPMDWLAVTSLDGEVAGWLPRPLLELDLVGTEGWQARPFQQTSNGLASGNCYEEALLHGLYELVERHGLANVRHQPQRKRPLDANALDDPDCRRLIQQIRQAGGKLRLYDATWEVGLPVLVAALIFDDLPWTWHGSGCHLCPAVALSRALTEAAQSRLTYIAGVRDDLPNRAWKSAVEGYADFQQPTPQLRLDQLPDHATSSLEGDVDRLLECLEAHRREIFVLDLSRPEVPGSVVRTFAPRWKEAHYG